MIITNAKRSVRQLSLVKFISVWKCAALSLKVWVELVILKANTSALKFVERFSLVVCIPVLTSVT